MTDVPRPTLPAGIQQILRTALVDPQFRRLLLGEDRDLAIQAATARGLFLIPAEEAVLRAIPVEQLRLTLEQLQLSVPTPVPPAEASSFPPPAGIRPDTPPMPPRPDLPPDQWVSFGIQPDLPPPRDDTPSGRPVSRGIQPDLPPEKPHGWWRRLFGK